MARPTKYTEDTPKQVLEYLGQWMNEDAVPSIEGLADFLDVNKTTLYEWDNKHPEFSNVLDKVRNKQARILFNGSLKGDLNASISKLMLTKHGYSDKQQTDSVSSDGSMSPTEKVVFEIVDPNED